MTEIKWKKSTLFRELAAITVVPQHHIYELLYGEESYGGSVFRVMASSTETDMVKRLVTEGLKVLRNLPMKEGQIEFPNPYDWAVDQVVPLILKELRSVMETVGLDVSEKDIEKATERLISSFHLEKIERNQIIH